MEKELLIDASNIHFSFLLQNQASIKQYFLSLGRKKLFFEKEVLRGIDLKVYKGESIGLLGRNGSGKSTFLRVLAGIITPDKGKVKVYGRVAPVMALGVGFEMEMTGMENIKLLGSLIGMSKKEINNSLDYIKEFSELGEALDMQVKRYSSGMMARLGFSIATSGNPDILIVDEALAVGDKGFQEKCMKRILEIKANGGTLLFVSHSIEEVKKYCTRAVLLNNGVIEMEGNVDEVGNKYLDIFK
jgi:ABC-type polysaccharide/polyol phosphate transport system ATPase subunit